MLTSPMSCVVFWSGNILKDQYYFFGRLCVPFLCLSISPSLTSPTYLCAIYKWISLHASGTCVWSTSKPFNIHHYTCMCVHTFFVSSKFPYHMTIYFLPLLYFSLQFLYNIIYAISFCILGSLVWLANSCSI